MSEEKKKTNRKRPDNSGRKKEKAYKKRTFSLSLDANAVIDALPEKPKGYRTLWVETAIIEHEVRHQIILEAAKSFKKLAPMSQIASILNSYDDTLTDAEVLTMLQEINRT